MIAMLRRFVIRAIPLPLLMIALLVAQPGWGGLVFGQNPDPQTVEKTPAEESPSEETPSEETPSEETPSEESPGEETPGERAPSEKVSSEESPGESAAGKETGDKETADKETGDKETSDEMAANDESPSRAGAAEAEPGQPAPGGVPPAGKPSALVIPSEDRSGRPFRPIGFYLSQLTQVVPKDFRPLSIDDLRRSLAAVSDELTDATQARLSSSFYDVRLDGEVMISQHSELVIDHVSELEVRRPLGEVNLALAEFAGGFRSPSQDIATSVPHLEVDAEGQLIAVIPDRGSPETSPEASSAAESSSDSVPGGLNGWRQSKLRFGWSLQGERTRQGKRFELLLPRTSQTRLVISTPADVLLESREAVLSERPGPPPDADVESRTGDIRWYVLEAGGLNRVTLDARRITEDQSEQAILIRRDSKQYQVDLSGVSWTHRMTIELQRQRETLGFFVPRGTVTHVRVNSVETPFRLTAQGDDRVALLQIDLPSTRAGRPSAANGSRDEQEPRRGGSVDLVTLTIEGDSNWDLRDGVCALSSAIPADPNVLATQTESQSIVTVAGPLVVAEWELPPAWQQSTQSPTREDELVLSAEGPPPEVRGQPTVWSRLRLIAQEDRFIDEVWMRIRLQQTPATVVRSATRVRCRLLQNHQSPFRLRVNPEWTIDAVKIVGSGRRIISPVNAGQLVIWPTPSESAQATFEIEVLAQRSITRPTGNLGTRPTGNLGTRPTGSLGIAPTWVVRPEERVASHLISVEPPPLRRWDANSVMLPGRFSSDSLDEEANAFFQPTGETVLLKRPSGDIPGLLLEPVDVSFGVTLRHVIGTEEGNVSETIVIRADTTQPIPSLAVLTGQDVGADFSWSLRRTDQSATVSLPASLVNKVADDPVGTYEIQLEGRDLRQFELVGRRLFSAAQEFTLSLPSVRRARSQTAEVLLDESWEVVNVPRGVQLVPGSGDRSPAVATDDDFQHLRYDPGLRPEIRLRRASTENAACLVWFQRLEFLANCRSEDQVYLFAEVSTRQPIHVVFDDELEAVSISRNGSTYDPERTGAGEFWIQPERQSDRIAVVFRRRHGSDRALRRCLVPEVGIDGEVIRSQTSSFGGTGSLLLFQRAVDSAGGGEPEGSGGSNASATELFLMPRHVAIGFGWLASLVIFGFAWAIARWLPLGIHSLFVLAVLSFSGAIIWWPWQLAILGWVTIPIVAGALLHAVLAESSRPTSHTGRRGGSVRTGDDTRSRQRTKDPSTDFSLSARTSLMALAIATAWAFPTQGVAQNGGEENRRAAGGSPSNEDPIELLVPLDERQNPVGDKVYLSRSDYESFRADVDPDRPAEVRFLSAEYRVLLSYDREAAEPIGAEIQATYQIQLSRQASRIRLPIPAEALKRIEWLSDGNSQILRDSVDERGMVVVTIPASRQIRLRLALVPTLSTNQNASPVSTAADLIGQETRSAASTSETAQDQPRNAPRLVINPVGERTDWTEVRLAIPPIHTSKLIVEAPPEISLDSLGTPRGRSRLRSDVGRYEADLGPVEALSIRCRPARRGSTTRRQRLRRAYRISAGVRDTVVECEIEFEDRESVGDVIQLTILGAAPDGVTSRGWSMERPQQDEDPERPAALIPSAGGVFRFVNRSGTDSPIRLLWRLPSRLNDPTSTDDSEVMPIPEVFASSSSRDIPTVFALYSPASIRISELASEAQPVSLEEFLARWKGYPGKVQRAFLSPETFPSFVLLKEKYATPATNLDHQLHVAPSGMQLTLRAELVDSRPGTRRVMLSIPDGFRLVNCLINDDVVTATTIRAINATGGGGGGAELPLGDRRDEGTTTIQAIALRDGVVGGLSEVPRFLLSTDATVTENYRITRDQSMSVQVIAPETEAAESEQDPVPRWRAAELTESDLASGQVPVSVSEQPGGSQIRASRRPAAASFRCDQMIRMRYADGRWLCDTLLEIPAGRKPDYVDVELPTRWATDLAVQGATLWAVQESSDAVTTVVRLALADPGPDASGATRPADDAPDANADADAVRRIQLTGGLDNRDQSRVGVPPVEVLGSGVRNLVVAVPDQLTTESIQWRSQSVRFVDPGADRLEWFRPRSATADRYSFYAPVERRWSIELEPISQATVEPVVLACDARVFLDGDRALVLQRFDVLPETLGEITLTLPDDAACIGIWSAGREIDRSVLGTLVNGASPSSETPEASGTRSSKVRVPLSYSRLPQPLEVLIEVPSKNRQLRDYLTQPVGLPTELIWVAFYQTPAEDAGRRFRIDDTLQALAEDGLTNPEAFRQRSLELANSVVTAIDRSRDMLAERSDEEIKRWLFPWLSRYQAIASSDGHVFRLTQAGEEATDDDRDRVADDMPQTGVDSAGTPGPLDRWSVNDAKLLSLAERFLQPRPNLPRPLFDPHRFVDYELVAVQRLDSFDEQPQLTQTFTPRKSLQVLLLNAITLLTFGLAMILLWPFRGRFQDWIREPALWLFTIGFLGIFLIPFPLAVTVMIVSMTVPLINRFQAARLR